ncbi:MAG: hypothetical protein ACKOX7_03025 [Bacteroidota bacterium]
MNESNLMELLLNNSIKPKAKSMEIALHLSEGKLHPETIVGLLGKASFSQIARLLESVELASKTHPGLVSPTLFDKAIDLLLSSEPAVKRESARIIANAAHLFPQMLNKATKNLLINCRHEGTVVRWSAALALGEILKLKGKGHNDLAKDISLLAEMENNSGVKNNYLKALKAIHKKKQD